jgi:hypothetical protein
MSSNIEDIIISTSPKENSQPDITNTKKADKSSSNSKVLTTDQARQENYPNNKRVVINPSGDESDPETSKVVTPSGETYTPTSDQNDIELNKFEEVKHKVETDSVETPSAKRIYRQATGKNNTGAAYDLESGQWMETRHSKEAPKTDTFVSAKKVDDEVTATRDETTQDLMSEGAKWQNTKGQFSKKGEGRLDVKQQMETARKEMISDLNKNEKKLADLRHFKDQTHFAPGESAGVNTPPSREESKKVKTEYSKMEDSDVTTEQEGTEKELTSKDIVALIHAITELNTSIIELKKVFEGNEAVLDSVEKLSIVVNNFGNQIIVNNGKVEIGDDSTTTNINNISNTPTYAPKPSYQETDTTENLNIENQADTKESDSDSWEDIPEQPTIQDLEDQKIKLEQKLNDPNITQEQYNAINITIGKIENTINISINGASDTELSDAEKEEQLQEQKEAAEYFLDDKLTDQEKRDFEESSKNDKTFFAQIKRFFKGSGWKKFVTEGAKRFGSNLAISSAVGGTVTLLGPVGATMVGGAMAVMGGITLSKGIKMVKAEAKASGRTVKEVWKDKTFMKGVLHGTLTSGVGRLTTMGISGLMPGVGGFLGASVPALASASIGTGLEHSVEFFAERDFQKKERDFMEKLSSNYNYRNYHIMVDEGYLIDGAEIEGTKNLNIKGITENLRNIESIKEKDEANFAIKSAVATQLELYNQTKDERYRYIEYTENQYGAGSGYGSYGGYVNTNTPTKRLDLTQIGLQEHKGSTDEYPLLEFKPPIDAYINGINTQQLADNIEAGWESIKQEDVENVGLRIIQNIAGLEAAEVDSVLSEEKKLYYEKVRYMSGWRMGTCVVNAASLIGGGLSIAGKGIATGTKNIRNRQANKQAIETEIEQTRTELGDNDAGVEIMKTETGEKVYAIDLDNDSKVDLYKTETGEMYSTSIVGAEKAFELSNGLSEADVSVTPLGNSQTGIAGTIVDNNTGEVLGVAIDGGNGNWTTMSVNELEDPLSASVTGTNQAANINITNIQPNGLATVNIDGNTYETNLTTLNDIPSIPGTEGLPGGGSVNIDMGDSMPVILRKALADAAQSNDKLAEAYANDPHIMERKLYQGNYLENDASIRNETNLTNPLRTDNNDGVFEYKDSNLVMKYLQELNGGQPVVLPGGSPESSGQPGYNLGFNANVNNPQFNNLSPLEIDTSYVTTDIPAGGALTSIAALGLGTLFDREPHVMTRETTVTETHPEYYQPNYRSYGSSNYYGYRYSRNRGENGESEYEVNAPYEVLSDPNSVLFESSSSQVEKNSSFVNIKIKKAFSDIFKSPPENGYDKNGWRNQREVKNDASPAYLHGSNNSEQILEQYLNRQRRIFPEYREAVSEIANKIKPISKDCKVSIAIPALGEAATIQRTLEQFTKLQNPETFEVCILDTYPVNSQDKTEDLVREFSRNNPSINIVYIKREVGANTNVGESRKFLSDVILERVSRIQDTEQRDDYIIVSQDADLQLFENTDYIDRIINHFDRKEDSEVLLGRSNIAREALIQAPNVLAAWRAWYTFDLIADRELNSVQKTIGRNTAMKATTLAGIGGYNPFLKLAEDLDIGWKVGMLRNRDSINYDPGIGLQGEARRALVAKLNNVPIVQMYNDFHQNGNLRNKDWEQIIKENPKKFEFEKNDFAKELTALYQYAKTLPSIRSHYNTIFSKTMYALGVQYHIENDQVIIDNLTKDITKVIQKEKEFSEKEKDMNNSIY